MSFLAGDQMHKIYFSKLAPSNVTSDQAADLRGQFVGTDSLFVIFRKRQYLLNVYWFLVVLIQAGIRIALVRLKTGSLRNINLFDLILNVNI